MLAVKCVLGMAKPVLSPKDFLPFLARLHMTLTDPSASREHSHAASTLISALVDLAAPQNELFVGCSWPTVSLVSPRPGFGFYQTQKQLQLGGDEHWSRTFTKVSICPSFNGPPAPPAVPDKLSAIANWFCVFALHHPTSHTKPPYSPTAQ